MPESIERDEPSIIAGDRLVTDNESLKVIPEVQNTIIKIFPSATPLTVLTTRKQSRKREVGYYKFEHLEKDKYPRKVTVNTAAAAGATTIVVETSDYTKLAKNYVLLNTRSREQVVLTETPASGTLSNVVRAIGGGGAQMNVGDTLLIQRPVQQEADTLGVIRSIKESRKYNYTEIIRTPMGWSGRNANTSYYGGSDPEQVRAATAIEHRISQENAAFFGKRHTRTTGDNKLQTFTGGLEYWIESHVWDLDGNTMTERGLVEWMEDVMALGDGGYINGPGVKWLYAGNSLLTEIEFFARDKIRYEALSSKIGMRAGQFNTTHGTLNIMRHPQFTGDHAGWGFVVDMNHVRYAYHRNRDTMLLKDRHQRSFDGAEEEFLTDCGWQIEEQFAHGIIKNHRIRVE
jgi:hypothetical protein